MTIKKKPRRKYIFNEETGTYNAKSKRYQTLRKQEKDEKEAKFNRLFEIYTQQLNDPDYVASLSAEELRVLNLKYKTILRTRKIEKKKQKELEIPFRVDGKTIVYIRESQVFNQRWVELFGRTYIKQRVNNYKKLLTKTENI
jgi:hypothetical protein